MRPPPRKQRRGFTLTELMVSLVMGLIVSLAAVGLAKSATSTFHEQARSSTTEMSLRMASSRLRADLSRASYMATGNIQLDPKVARLIVAGTPKPEDITRYSEITTLRGVKIDVNTLTMGGIPGVLSDNGIKPDAIELVGNYTTDDAYSGTLVSGALSTSGHGTCKTAQTIVLDPAADAATYTLSGANGGTIDTTQLGANARAALLPKDNKKFLAQVTDAIGCTHYVSVCDVGTGSSAAGTPVLHVMLEAPDKSPRAVLFSNTTATDQGPLVRNCGASDGGRVTIAPLSRVRWRVAPAAAGIVSDPVADNGKKTDLVREVLDFSGAVQFTEVVAEYVVDMKFGIVVDEPKASGADRQKVYEMDTDPEKGDIWRITTSDSSVIRGEPGPQRVRAVRYRLAARASVADRTADINLDAGAVKGRVCVDDTYSATNCKKWARVRTVVSEVSLANQVGMNW